jgi:hypothetical protein
MVAIAPPRTIDAPGADFTSSGPTTPTRRPGGGADAGARFAETVVVVVCAPPHPAAVKPQSSASAMRAPLIRIPSK